MENMYHQLTEGERTQIFAYTQVGWSIRRIARVLQRRPSTISRELRRNRGGLGYRTSQAHRMALDRRARSGPWKATEEVIAFVEERLRLDHSPEQISGSMGVVQGVTLSHTWIYQHVWADKRNGGDLYRHLRWYNGSRNRKRRRRPRQICKIPDRTSITERPAIVAEKGRYGDWEADLVTGSYHRGYLVTLVERKSKYTVIGHLQSRTADGVSAEIIRILGGVRAWVHTITYDNGGEFTEHGTVARSLGCNSYFATPHHAWERGLNENTNGLIRQYFPKKADLRPVTHEQLDFVMERLNNRPRKTLGFKTPLQVLITEGLIKRSVALRC